MDDGILKLRSEAVSAPAAVVFGGEGELLLLAFVSAPAGELCGGQAMREPGKVRLLELDSGVGGFREGSESLIGSPGKGSRLAAKKQRAYAEIS